MIIFLLLDKLADDRYAENGDFKSDESKLRHAVMNGYAPDFRPVLLTNTVTYVNISLSNIQIMNLAIFIYIDFLNKG